MDCVTHCLSPGIIIGIWETECPFSLAWIIDVCANAFPISFLGKLLAHIWQPYFDLLDNEYSQPLYLVQACIIGLAAHHIARCKPSFFSEREGNLNSTITSCSCTACSLLLDCVDHSAHQHPELTWVHKCHNQTSTEVVPGYTGSQLIRVSLKQSEQVN